MSTTPPDPSPPPRRRRWDPRARNSALSLGTSAYLGAVTVVAVAATAAAEALSPTIDTRDLVTFALLATCSAVSARFIVPTGQNHGFHTAIVFIVAATLQLPPLLVALTAISQHVPDWLARRYPWYIQTFNASNYTLDALAAWAVAHALLHVERFGDDAAFALAGIGASGTLVLLNHGLLAVALRLARGWSFRESGLFSGHSLSVDGGLALLGVGLAALAHANPYLTPVVIAPLALIRRSFSLLALLRQSEERFRAVFESTAMGIRLADVDGRVVTANRAFERLLGYGRDELTGMSVADVAHPADRHEEQAGFAAVVSGARETFDREVRLLRRDGGEIWAHVTSSLVRDNDGNPRFVIGMAQDVTRARQLEAQLVQAQKMEAVGRLAGGIAHDFNNFLTVIETYTTFALSDIPPNAEALRADVEEIQEAGKKAASLTRQLLAFSRRNVAQPEVLDLNAVVADTQKMLRRLLGEDIEIVTPLEAHSARVKADPGELAQVLINLAVNARDAMPRGGRLTIETSDVDVQDATAAPSSLTLAPGGYVRLSVRDTGVGMDEETRSRIFEPFFTTKDVGKGTGLGLAMVYGIVTQSGGSIEVESAPDRGTTFSLYFPRVDEPITAEAETAEPAGTPTGTETVLLVEDEDVIRNAVRRILRGRGYEVLEAWDGSEALQIAEHHGGAIDLVVTDVVMPQMRGFELVEELLQRRPGLKVLYMSGYTDEDDITARVTGGGVAFLQKPFTEDEIGEKVRSLLDGEEPRQPGLAAAVAE